MGLIQKTSIKRLSQHKFMRFDPKYLNTMNTIKFKNFIILKNLFKIINGNSYTKDYVDNITSKAFLRISDLTFQGDINNNNIIYLNENTKIPKLKKLKKDDFILATIGATIGKINLAKNFEGGTFSNNTVVLRSKKEINFYFYEKLFQANIMQKYIFGIASQKAQPNLQTYDIEEIKIPNIPLIIQNKTIAEIEPLENEIKKLKTEKKADLESINKVFSETFNIELAEIKKLDKVKRFNLNLQEVMLKNDALRTSFKWHKLEQIQSYMYKNINSITKLSTVILNTKNGWSPESSEVEEGTAVLGQEHILKNGKISLNASKYTTLSKNNIENFYVKKNDFFVSRGNTLELVAMAGVVNQEVFDNILYPDLYIKVEFKENKVHKQYMAYLFNSFIGRVYFNHVAKGKNQTMVKISSKEILDFYVPLPSMEIQEKIVKQIQEQIDIQKEIDNKILEKQDAINALIETCIKQEQGQ